MRSPILCIILAVCLAACGPSWYPPYNAEEVEMCRHARAIVTDSTRTGCIAGRVINAQTGKLLDRAIVNSRWAKRWTYTDSAGQFTLPDIYLGSYSISASDIGYFPWCTTDVKVFDNDTTWLEIRIYYNPKNIMNHRRLPELRLRP